MSRGNIGTKQFLTTFHGAEYASTAREQNIVPPRFDKKASGVLDETLENRLMLLIYVESIGEALLIVLGAALLYLTASYLLQRDSFEIGSFVIMVLYLLPTGIAELRKHNRALDIMITNLWLGWTIIGWVFVLLWACDWNTESDS